MAPEVVSTALRAVRTRFWVPLLVPFVSKVHEASQWARNFALCACRRVFQQPRLKADPGLTEGSGALVANHAAGEAGQDWSKIVG